MGGWAFRCMCVCVCVHVRVCMLSILNIHNFFCLFAILCHEWLLTTFVVRIWLQLKVLADLSQPLMTFSGSLATFNSFYHKYHKNINFKLTDNWFHAFVLLTIK